MDMYSNNKVMMDFVRLETEVRQKANDYLDEISESNLKAFAESTKYIAQSVLENFYLSVDAIYTKGALKIENNEKFDSFIDFHDGYRAKMKEWVAENEIKIKEMTVDPTIQSPKFDDNDTNKTTPLVISGVGTLVAVGLFIFTEMWIAVAAELLVLGVAFYTYKKSQESRMENYAFQLKRYEMQIEQEKARLVNGLIKDLKIWLSNAENFSKDLISNFGI